MKFIEKHEQISARSFVHRKQVRERESEEKRAEEKLQNRSALVLVLGYSAALYTKKTKKRNPLENISESEKRRKQKNIKSARSELCAHDERAASEAHNA